MDHLHATQTHAAERYLLGELPAAEAEQFELHFFECAQCALAVEGGELFLEGARAHFRHPEGPAANPKPDARPSFADAVSAFFRRPLFTMPVMAALAAVTIYQGAFQIPGLEAVLHSARSLPAIQLIGASRGEEATVHIPPGSPFLSISADIPPGASFQRYLCVLTGGEREISSSLNPPPLEGQPITILIPAAQLKSGSYQLTVYGVAPDGQRSDRISTYPFGVKFD